MLPRSAKGTPRASYSSRCHDTVGCTTSRPSLSRSRVASSLASSTGWRSGAMTAPITSLTRRVAAATAASSTLELGQHVAGSWLPGAA